MSEQIATFDHNNDDDSSQLSADDHLDHDAGEQAAPPSSYRVIEENMLFWHERAHTLQQHIFDFIKDHPHRNAPGAIAHLSKIAQLFADSRQKAVDAAAKLIAFQAPKLSSIDIESKRTHQFVIRAPAAVNDAQSWLAQVDEQKSLQPAQPLRALPDPATKQTELPRSKALNAL